MNIMIHDTDVLLFFFVGKSRLLWLQSRQLDGKSLSRNWCVC